MTDSEKLDLIISKIAEIDKKLTEHDKSFVLISEKLTEHDKSFVLISEKLTEHDKKLDKLDKIDNEITDIKLTLENEIRTNIKRVAEGHLDLSRQFEITTKLDNEKEMLAIRVSMLETEMRRLRQQLNQMAG